MHCHLKTCKAEATTTSSVLLILISATSLLFVISSQVDLAQARYLPTRADESSVEALKELIRGIIIQSNMDQLEAKLAGRIHQQDNRLNSAGPSFRIERRSSEIPQGSAGDSFVRLSEAHSQNMD